MVPYRRDRSVAYHLRTKHVKRRYHWLRERVEERDFTLVKVHTDDNGSDMVTKVLSMGKLSACRQKVGLLNYPHLGVKGESVENHVPLNGMISRINK